VGAAGLVPVGAGLVGRVMGDVDVGLTGVLIGFCAATMARTTVEDDVVTVLDVDIAGAGAGATVITRVGGGGGAGGDGSAAVRLLVGVAGGRGTEADAPLLATAAGVRRDDTAVV
jgi:hypothetical protein